MNRIARATVTAFRPRLAQQVARVPTKFAFVRQPVQFAVRSFGADHGDHGMEHEGEVREGGPTAINCDVMHSLPPFRDMFNR